MKLQNRTDIYKLGLEVERVVCLGDPHGDVEALERVLEIESAPNTVFVSVGDNIGYKSADLCSRLVTFLKAKNIPSVWGNHEHWSDEDGTLFLMHGKGNKVLKKEALEFCKSLPRKIKIESEHLSNVEINVQHSIFDPKTGEWDWITSSNAPSFIYGDIVVTGHSHRLGLHILSKENPNSIVTMILDHTPSASMEIKPENRYVLDSGSISRADDGYPEFKHGTYSVLNLKSKTLEIRRFNKREESKTCQL